MGVSKHNFVFAIIFILLAMLSCQQEEDFSSDPNLMLNFSTDSLGFGTVFSETSTPTLQFKIYNNTSKGLTIESIELVDAANSGFKLNVDGQMGTKFTNVDLLKNDSLFAFVELKTPATNTHLPFQIKDLIRFTTNGNVQYVRLEATGQNVYVWKGKVLDTDTILTDQRPFLIYDSLVIKKGVRVEIKENTKFFFHHKASFNIYGSIDAKGKVGKPIELRGDRLDKMNNTISYDNVPGQWRGVLFGKDSYNNSLNYFFVRNGEQGLLFAESSPAAKKAVLKNCIIQNTSNDVLSATNCDIDVSNCLLANSGGATVSLRGGEYSFTHCTIANYFQWSSRRDYAFVISNNIEGVTKIPLTKCDVINTIVYGSQSGRELYFDQVANTSFTHRFINCLLKGVISNDANFTNTIWNASPQFVNLNSNRNYKYNFELKDGSPAIDKADINYSTLIPLDLNGHLRTSDSGPDIGCYEWKSN